MAVFKKQSGAWKECDSFHVKDGGVWKNASQMFVKDGGVWKSLCIKTYNVMTYTASTDTDDRFYPVSMSKDPSGNLYILYYFYDDSASSHYWAVIAKFSPSFSLIFAKKRELHLETSGVHSCYLSDFNAVAFPTESKITLVHTDNSISTVEIGQGNLHSICNDPRYTNRVFVAKKSNTNNTYDNYAYNRLYNVNLSNYSSSRKQKNGLYTGSDYSTAPSVTQYTNLVFNNAVSKLYYGGMYFEDDYVSTRTAYYIAANVSGYDITSISKSTAYYKYQSGDSHVHIDYISNNCFSGTNDKIICGNLCWYDNGDSTWHYRFGIIKINSGGSIIAEKYISDKSSYDYNCFCEIDDNNNAILVLYGTYSKSIYIYKFDSSLTPLLSREVKIVNSSGALRPINLTSFHYNDNMVTLAGYRDSSNYKRISFIIEVPTALNVPLNTDININGTYYVRFQQNTITYSSTLGHSVEHRSNEVNSSGISSVTSASTSTSTFSASSRNINTYDGT